MRLPFATALLVGFSSVLPVLAAGALEPPPQWYVLRYGANRIAKAPTAPQLNLSAEFTMEAWVYLERQGKNTWLLGKASAITSWAYAFMIAGDNSGSVQFIQSNGRPGSSANTVAVNSPEAFPLRRWTHLAGTLENGILRLFIDGVQVGQAASPGPPGPEPAPFGVGGAFATADVFYGALPGAMRQVRVWSRALPAGELIANASKWLKGGEPGLLAYWPLDDGKGQTARDLGPNHLPLLRGLDASLDWSDPAWIHTAIVDQGPFFELEGPLEVLPAVGPGDPGLRTGHIIDFDNDEVPDLLLTTTFFSDVRQPYAPLLALHNDGQGHFADVTATVCPEASSRVGNGAAFVADFNGDGRQDIFLGDSGEDNGKTVAPSGQNRLLFQTADGRLEDVTDTNLHLHNVFTHCVAGGDFDGDGHPDVFAGTLGGPFNGSLISCSRLLRNDGHGKFSKGLEGLPYEVLRSSNGVGCVALDANKDGHLDLVIGGGLWEKHETLLLNDGHGNLAVAPEASLPIRTPAAQGWHAAGHHFTAGDLDDDGWPDLLFFEMGTNGSFARWSLFLNNKNGTFRDASSRIVFDPEARPDGVGPIIADLNGDGRLDFTIGSNEHMVLLGTSEGRFVDGSEFLPLGLGGPWNVYPADLDGNGSVDIVLVSQLGSSIRLLRQLKAPDVALLADAPRPLHRHLAH